MTAAVGITLTVLIVETVDTVEVGEITAGVLAVVRVNILVSVEVTIETGEKFEELGSSPNLHLFGSMLAVVIGERGGVETTDGEQMCQLN